MKEYMIEGDLSPPHRKRFIEELIDGAILEIGMNHFRLEYRQIHASKYIDGKDRRGAWEK